MAKIFAIASGSIVGIVQDPMTETLFLSTNPIPAATMEFDENTNPALLQDLLNNQSKYTLTIVNNAPVLKKSSVTVGVTAAETLFALKAAIIAGFTDVQFRNVIAALWNGTATSAQQQKAIAYLALKLRQANII